MTPRVLVIPSAFQHGFAGTDELASGLDSYLRPPRLIPALALNYPLEREELHIDAWRFKGRVRAAAAGYLSSPCSYHLVTSVAKTPVQALQGCAAANRT